MRNLGPTINALKNTPTDYVNRSGHKCHESLLRSYQILQFAKDWLANGVPGDAVLSVIEYMESLPEAEMDKAKGGGK